MRRGWMRWMVGACGLAGPGLFGCHADHGKLIPPPKLVEEYVLPPEDDPHWSKPPSYPSDTLNQPMQKPTNGPNMNGPTGQGPGSAPGTTFGPSRGSGGSGSPTGR